MDLLQQGVEQYVIALWLGHESIETTQVYLDANLELKQRFSTKSHLSAERLDGIDPTTSCSPSSEACDNTDYVPGQPALHLDDDPRHGATGHSPTRDIIGLGMSEQRLNHANVRCVAKLRRSECSETVLRSAAALAASLNSRPN